MIVDEEVYLGHHGVKGMHWGVRNFINTQKKRRLNKYGDKSVKPLTKAQKQARSDRRIQRARIAGVSVLLGTYVTLNILAANANRKASETRFKDAFDEERFKDAFRNARRGGFGGGGSTGRARAAASAARGERAVKDIINSERASQAASLLRMHQEGKMDAQQHAAFLKKLNLRYDRKIAGLG